MWDMGYEWVVDHIAFKIMSLGLITAGSLNYLLPLLGRDAGYSMLDKKG